VEGDRARRLTSLAVAGTLALALLCLAVGAALAWSGPADWATAAVPAADLPAAIGRGAPSGWLSLGGLLLIAVPSVRVVGMLAEFGRSGQRGSLIAGTLLLAILLGGAAKAAFAPATPEAAAAGDPAAPGSATHPSDGQPR
jgi:hypothetical protein